ncbi:FAD-dependent oxidoreductase [Mesomycoplasma lagogenitalium]|uniref:FAD-dependent oxidoreductase n=1 Tax=Mesomycoplasma lagogenitalium TaxID=171286 RepID=A0ABY8LWQ0_9BACT|nr:FAD-dependent oxidoreductase [Mesomycoplasma lagogenitalium]WGI36738.1 FAD-dependent oxidoreductase [Mesomycoplasma lagogenitalium]
MKIISVGANHAGTSFLRTMKKIAPDAHLVAYDRNTDISFLGCGIALWVGGEFDTPDGLFYSSIEELKNLGVDVKIAHEVVEINREEKYVLVKDLNTGETFKDTYDKLVYAGGTWPIVPAFENVDLENIIVSKIFAHAKEIKAKAVDPEIKNVVVVGAGYIGIELVEAFHKYGKHVTLVDMQDRIIPNYFDPEFTSKVEESMKQHGIKLQLGERVQRFETEDGKTVSAVVTDKGTYAADLVILAIGFKPNTELIQGVEKTENTAIKVDKFQRSLSDEDLYVIGDSASMIHNSTGEYTHIALATNAVKSGIVAAFHLAGNEGITFPGYSGTNAINVFNYNYSSTGLTDVTAAKYEHLKDKVASEYFEDNDRPEFMRHHYKVWIKLTYDKETLRLLGAQIGSQGRAANHTEVMYMLSLAIQQQLTLPQIALMDYYFLPHFNKPFNFIIQTILNALGLKYNE